VPAQLLISSITLILLLLFGFAFLGSALRIVPQQQSWVVERLGRYQRVLSPGLNVLVPFVDRVAYRFDLREVP
jgi:regulator of protease activity HflC (stomatin/prohibitin superfamily)